MSQHPIEGLMDTAMRSIKEMVDVNSIIGDTVKTENGTVIIPVSKVSFGFASGGGEYAKDKKENQESANSLNNQNGNSKEELPFAGGSAAGVSICPVAFMTVTNGEVRLLPVNTNASVDKLLDLIPDLFKKKDHKCKEEINNNGKENGDVKKSENTLS